MGPPAKKRKLNGDSKASPSASKSLDYFFGKKQEKLPIQTNTPSSQSLDESMPATTALSDEELARKLQAEWNQEGTAYGSPDEETKVQAGDSLLDSMVSGVKTNTTDGDTNRAESVPKTTTMENGFFSSPLKNKNTLSLQSASSVEDTIASNIPFDESPLTFEPSKYIEDLQKHWAVEGGNATYALLTRCFVLVNSTQSRIKIVDTLVNLLRVIIEGDPASLLPTVGPILFANIMRTSSLAPSPTLFSSLCQSLLTLRTGLVGNKRHISTIHLS